MRSGGDRKLLIAIFVGLPVLGLAMSAAMAGLYLLYSPPPRVLRSSHHPASAPLVDRALNQIDSGLYSEALANLERAIEIDSSDARAFENKGYVLSAMGNDRGAVEYYSEALRLDPDYFLANANRSWSYLRLGMGDSAARDAQHVHSVSPGFFFGNSMAINAYLGHRMSGRSAEAVAVLKERLARIRSRQAPADTRDAYPVILHLLGETTAEGALAGASTPREAAGIHAVIAEDLLFSGKFEEARPHIDFCEAHPDSFSLPLVRAIRRRAEGL